MQPPAIGIVTGLVLSGLTGTINSDKICEDMTEKVVDYSDVEVESDLWYLAHIICGEAQNCDDQEQRYIASVVLNRVADSRFPDTIADVIKDTQYGVQYASWYDGNAMREPTQSNWENAEYVLTNGSVLPEGVIYQAGEPQDTVYEHTRWHYYCFG